MGAGSAEAGGLDHHALERRHLALGALEEQLAHGAHQVAAHRAAQAARVQRHHALVVGLLDQQVVEPDLAELVDDHRGVGKLGRRSSLFSSVVLPLPKKPVSTVTGMRCSAGGLVFAHRLTPSSGRLTRSARPS
jgi:hypothetical protein